MEIKENKRIICRTKKLLLAFVIAVTSLVFAACNAAELQNINDIEDVVSRVNLDKYPDAQNLMDVLQGKIVEEVPEEIEEEEVSYVSYKVCQEGYETNGRNYAIKVDEESGEAVYSIVDVDEAMANGAAIINKSSVYGLMADNVMQSYIGIYGDVKGNSPDVIKDADTLKRVIMDEADMLLFLEYYPEDSRRDSVIEMAEVLAKQIMNSKELAKDDLSLMYNTAAVLAKAEYVLADVDFVKELSNGSLELFNDAEGLNLDDNSADVSRAWASAELFRTTGIKTYRTLVESYALNGDLEGFGYDNPGYYAAFAYLNSPGTTDYGISGTIMNGFFARVNDMIKSDTQSILDECLDKGNMDGGDIAADYINSLIEELKISVIANRISMSVEYTRYAKDRIMFIGGANPLGIDYLDIDYIMNYDQIMFSLLGIEEH